MSDTPNPLPAPPPAADNDVTEAEASKKWCWAVRVYAGTASFNRHPENDLHEDTLCIGARCMAWRWKDGTNTEGHCGLAGA